MPGPYYCDLAVDFVAGRDGTNDTTEVLTGIGGVMSSLYGWGASAQIAAGETLWLKGTANAGKFIKWIVTADKSGTWVIGDVIMSGTEDANPQGSVFTGVLVYISATMLYVQCNLTAGGDYDDVGIPDGIDNTTRVESITAAQTTSVHAFGIELATGVAMGTQLDGRLVVRGTTDLSDPVANEGLAYIDGQAVADYALYISLDETNWYRWRYVSFEDVNIDAVGTAGSGVDCDYWDFELCRLNDSVRGIYGYSFNYLRMFRCIAAGNSSHGYYSVGADILKLCAAYNNGGQGILCSYGVGSFVLDCLARGNTLNNFYSSRATSTFDGCLADGSTAGSGFLIDGTYYARGGSTIFNSRAVNNNQYGIEYDLTITAETLHMERYNVFFGNVLGDLELTAGLGSDTSYGDDSNHISDPADDGIDVNFNVEAGKEHASTKIPLDWDQ